MAYKTIKASEVLADSLVAPANAPDPTEVAYKVLTPHVLKNGKVGWDVELQDGTTARKAIDPDKLFVLIEEGEEAEYEEDEDEGYEEDAFNEDGILVLDPGAVDEEEGEEDGGDVADSIRAILAVVGSDAAKGVKVGKVQEIFSEDEEVSAMSKADFADILAGSFGCRITTGRKGSEPMVFPPEGLPNSKDVEVVVAAWVNSINGEESADDYPEPEDDEGVVPGAEPEPDEEDLGFDDATNEDEDEEDAIGAELTEVMKGLLSMLPLLQRAEVALGKLGITL